MSRSGHASEGFSLVEMTLAIAIFALLCVALVGLVETSQWGHASEQSGDGRPRQPLCVQIMAALERHQRDQAIGSR